MANLYCTNRTTKKFNGVIRQAVLNPKYTEFTHDIKDKYLYNPRAESLIEPMSCGDDEAIILENGVWIKKIDKVGQIYYLQDGSKHYISEFNFDVPVGAIQTNPPSEYHDTHNGTDWIENTVKKAMITNNVFFIFLILIKRDTARSVFTRICSKLSNAKWSSKIVPVHIHPA